MKLMTEITIKWHIDDVLSVRPNLSESQASDILTFIKSHHDAEVGLNWEVIHEASEFLFPE